MQELDRKLSDFLDTSFAPSSAAKCLSEVFEEDFFNCAVKRILRYKDIMANVELFMIPNTNIYNGNMIFAALDADQNSFDSMLKGLIEQKKQAEMCIRDRPLPAQHCFPACPEKRQSLSLGTPIGSYTPLCTPVPLLRVLVCAEPNRKASVLCGTPRPCPALSLITSAPDRNTAALLRIRRRITVQEPGQGCGGLLRCICLLYTSRCV